MGGILDMFGKSSLGRLIHQSQKKLAAEDFDAAQHLVSKGLMLYPDAEPLREMELTIRRAQARAGIHSLKMRIERDEDPRAYEELVSLYLELGLHAEARTEALAYANAHPDRDTSHLLLGEMSLQAFFEDLLARDAHAASRRLTRAAALNPHAVKPRLLLAELFFCVGADRALTRIVQSIQDIAPEDPMLAPLMEKLQGIETPQAQEILDGIFESVEVEGVLEREPTQWPLRSRRTRVNRMDEDRAQRTANTLVGRGSPIEVAMIQRGGALVAHARAPGEDDGNDEERGLVNVTRTVARTVSPHVREFDLGRFKRCTIQGRFGIVTVGEVGGMITGARWRSNPEPQRLWERVAVQLEGSVRGGRR